MAEKYDDSESFPLDRRRKGTADEWGSGRFQSRRAEENRQSDFSTAVLWRSRQPHYKGRDSVCDGINTTSS